MVRFVVVFDYLFICSDHIDAPVMGPGQKHQRAEEKVWLRRTNFYLRPQLGSGEFTVVQGETAICSDQESPSATTKHVSTF